MIRSLSICLLLAALTALSLPGNAPAQTQEIQAEARLQLLEAKLQALLAEIKSMRAAPATPAVASKRDEKKSQQLRVVVDGDKVQIFDAITGKALTAAEAGPHLKLMQADAGKTGEKKIIVFADEALKSAGGGKVERKVVVVENGQKSDGNAKIQGKVTFVEDGKSPAGNVKKEKKAVVIGGDAKVVSGEGKTIQIEGLHFNIEDPKAAGTLRLAIEDSAAKGAFKIVAAPVKVDPTSKAVTESRSTFAYTVNSGSDTVMLSRTTYTLPAAKAVALESFLKENAKAKVLETKCDGDQLTVTTTPDVQSTIGGLIALMSGKNSTAAVPMKVHSYTVPQPRSDAGQPKRP
jgi:hypothetical protein